MIRLKSFLLTTLFSMIAFFSIAYLPADSAFAKTSYNYTVAKGDCLWLIAQRHNTTVDKLKSANNIKTDLLQIGQKLVIPGKAPVYQPVSRGAVVRPVPATAVFNPAVNTVAPPEPSIPVNDVKEEYDEGEENEDNAAGSNNDGDIEPLPGDNPEFGELLGWPEVNILFPRGATGTIRDLATGREFKIYRLFGSNHADCEPLTADDTRIMKEIFGGQWTWNRRAALLIYNGKVIACSMNGMPHGRSQHITNNNFNGHFCVHFFNSKTHSKKRVDPLHQAAVRKAAGL